MTSGPNSAPPRYALFDLAAGAFGAPVPMPVGTSHLHVGERFVTCAARQGPRRLALSTGRARVRGAVTDRPIGEVSSGFAVLRPDGILAIEMTPAEELHDLLARSWESVERHDPRLAVLDDGAGVAV